MTKSKVNHPYLHGFRIAPSSIAGQGVFAVIPFTVGDVIGVGCYNQGLPIITHDLGRWINHSYRPNVKLRRDERATFYRLVAMEPIAVGDEIVMDYTFTPWFIEKPLPHYVERPSVPLQKSGYTISATPPI